MQLMGSRSDEYHMKRRKDRETCPRIELRLWYTEETGEKRGRGNRGKYKSRNGGGRERA